MSTRAEEPQGLECQVGGYHLAVRPSQTALRWLTGISISISRSNAHACFGGEDSRDHARLTCPSQHTFLTCERINLGQSLVLLVHCFFCANPEVAPGDFMQRTTSWRLSFQTGSENKNRASQERGAAGLRLNLSRNTDMILCQDCLQPSIGITSLTLPLYLNESDSVGRWRSKEDLEKHYETFYLKDTHKKLKDEDLLARPEAIKMVDRVWGFGEGWNWTGIEPLSLGWWSMLRVDGESSKSGQFGRRFSCIWRVISSYWYSKVGVLQSILHMSI